MNLQEIQEIILHEKAVHTDPDATHYWELKTLRIELAKGELETWIEEALAGRIDAQAFRTALHRYFRVVYDESYKEWRGRRDAYRDSHRVPTSIDLPIYDIPIPYRELAFINERWQKWLADDGRGEWGSDSFIFDNKGIQPEYEWITPEDIERASTIGNENYELRFGKYGKTERRRGSTIKELYTVAPDYLVYMAGKGYLKLSKEIVETAKEWDSHFKNLRIARRDI